MPKVDNVVVVRRINLVIEKLADDWEDREIRDWLVAEYAMNKNHASTLIRRAKKTIGKHFQAKREDLLRQAIGFKIALLKRAMAVIEEISEEVEIIYDRHGEKVLEKKWAKRKKMPPALNTVLNIHRDLCEMLNLYPATKHKGWTTDVLDSAAETGNWEEAANALFVEIEDATRKYPIPGIEEGNSEDCEK